MSTERTIRILVLGDSGVGKTTFLEQLCNNISKQQQTTLGCKLHVQMHSYHESDYFVEYFDIGTNENLDKRATSLFYANDYDGIFYVFDLLDYSTLDSFYNVRQAINQIIQMRDNMKSNIYSGHLPTTFRRASTRRSLQNLPILFVGNNSSSFYEHTQTTSSASLLPGAPLEKPKSQSSIAYIVNFFVAFFYLILFIFTKIFFMSDYYRGTQKNSHMSKIRSTVHSLQQETLADYIELDCSKNLQMSQRRIIENFLDRVIMGNNSRL
jgi:GTPase SAR1 family protein